MTRINIIPVEELSREHLVAEYRELPRIFNLVRAAQARGESPCDPRNPLRYVLGPGHCRFFYAKLQYLADRQRALVDEMRKRGYAPQFDDIAGLLKGISSEWIGDWFPDEEAMALNRSRISERQKAGKVDPSPSFP